MVFLRHLVASAGLKGDQLSWDTQFYVLGLKNWGMGEDSSITQ